MLNTKNIVEEAREHEGMLGCVNYSWTQFFEDMVDYLLGEYDVDTSEFHYFIASNSAFFKIGDDKVMFTAVRDWCGIIKGFEVR